MPSHHPTMLDATGCDALADRLGNTPETTIPVHMLRRRLCSAHVTSEPDGQETVVLQSSRLPEEPLAYGNDIEAIWSILRDLPGWTCINVEAQTASQLSPLMQADLGRVVRHVVDIYFTLDRPTATFVHPSARSLTRDDLALLEGSSADVQEMALGFGTFEGLLAEGIAAGAVVEGYLVALACTTAQTGRHADVGVVTVEEWRGQGVATACAALVADGIHRSGRVPVWSTGEDNLASLRVARKLGFGEVGRRVYLVPSRRDPVG